jgi:hypothetical protein
MGCKDNGQVMGRTREPRGQVVPGELWGKAGYGMVPSSPRTQETTASGLQGS